MLVDAQPVTGTIVDTSRLKWVWPVTVATSVAAVLLVRVAAVAILRPDPDFAPLGWIAPTADTVILVSIAVGVYAWLAGQMGDVVRNWRRIAFAALLISFLPDLGMAANAGWPNAIALMVMHVAAWAVCVTVMPRLTVVTIAPHP